MFYLLIQSLEVSPHVTSLIYKLMFYQAELIQDNFSSFNFIIQLIVKFELKLSPIFLVLKFLIKTSKHVLQPLKKQPTQQIDIFLCSLPETRFCNLTSQGSMRFEPEKCFRLDCGQLSMFCRGMKRHTPERTLTRL